MAAWWARWIDKACRDLRVDRVKLQVGSSHVALHLGQVVTMIKVLQLNDTSRCLLWDRAVSAL